jgi:thiosulfate/3-mercaptopyruvate sulfurtransferase
MRPASLIDARSLSEELGDPALRVLDATVNLVRPPQGGPYVVQSGHDAYLAGHIPGAAFADVSGEMSDPASPYPFAVPSPERFAAAAGRLGIGAGTRVVTYSQHSPMWATRLWWLLRYFGFDDVGVLDGGLAAWSAAGLELQAGERVYAPATFDSRPRVELLADIDEVRGVAGGERSACLVNALAPEVFRGEGPSSYARPGRIPGSVSAYWGELLDPASGRFLEPERLRAKLTRSGVLDAGEVIAYCGGGISATVDLFALSLLDRQDARLYDGSLTEWTAHPELPVELG